MKKIFYIGNFSFPFGNASGARVLGNGYALRELGYEVEYIGLDNNLQSDKKINDTLNVFENFKYYNFPYPKSAKNRFNYIKIFNELKKILIKEKPDIIILYGSLSISLINEKIRNWAKKNNVKIFVDCVDMLPTTNGGLIFKIVKTLDEFYQKDIFNKKVDGLIAISSYIKNYYKNRIPNSIVVPPLSIPNRYNQINKYKFDTSKLNLIYIGNPFPTDGRKVDKSTFKDRLDLVIEVLNALEEKKFIFRIYGLTKETYLKVLPEHRTILETNSDCIVFNGPVNNVEAIELIKASDFSILLRDVNKMSTAGFPTKFTESLACGTPVITNNTSDIEKYLLDNKNGFLIKDLKFDYLKKCFKEILKIDQNQLQLMKEFTNCNNPFIYTNFNEEFKKLLNE